MRVSKFVRTLAHLCAFSGALLISSSSFGQELLPSVSFSGESAWSSGGSWLLDGSDPPEDGVPAGDEIAVINGGVANLNSSVDGVHSLSISKGTLSLASGGSVEVENQTIVGSGGVLSVAGGSLTTGSLAVLGTIDIDPSLAGDSAFGTSVPVATTSSVLGVPRKFTVGGSAANLPTGLGWGLVPSADGAAAVVESLPILEVSRETGAASIKNMLGGPIDISGYTVSSAGALLKRTGGAWNSLEDQAVAGWVEANPDRTSRFSELNLLGSSTLAVGDAWDIGSIYTGIGEPPAKEDLKFEFLLADGRVMSTAVSYTGPPNDLFLAVDPATGAASLNHVSPLIAPFDVTGVSILSDSGSLNTAAFEDGLFGDGWANANPQASAYTEVSLESSRVFANGDSLDLGSLFSVGGAQDLKFTFSTTDGAVRTGSVIYGGDPIVVGPTCDPGTQGDLDGNGRVEFADFLVLSNNFGTTLATPDHALGDIDCDGAVAFSDFLVLSNNFGNAVGAEAASVPEPSSGLLLFLGFLGMLKFRKRASHVAVVVAAVALCSVGTQETLAEDFDARFIRVHPAGPNNGIANLVEAAAIINGTVIDAILNEDLTGTVTTVDIGGGVGTFEFDQEPYLNGVDNEDMNNIIQYVTGTVEIPAGDWTIGCGSDDGCMVRFSEGITFDETFNENGPLTDGDGEIFFNPGRGHDWTFGTFSVPAGGVTTGIEMLFYEGGGGDSFEVAILDEKLAEEFVTDDEGNGNGDLRRAEAANFLELTDGAFDWEVTGAPFAAVAGDFNFDGVVDMVDAEILTDNFGDEGGFRQGDMDLDGEIGFGDASLFAPIYQAAQAGGEASASVPEPSSVSLVLLGLTALLGFRQRKRA